MVKIMIDAGHGAQDSGAIGNGLKEKDLTLTIAKRIKAILEKYDGVEVRLTRATDVFLELSERADLANSWKADLFISIHINAGGGTGFESFIYNDNPKASTVAAQNIIHAAIMKQIGGTDRGKKRANHAVTRESNMTAILTEAAFIDNVKDAARLKSSDFIEKYAQGHVDGVVTLFGLKGKVSTVKPVTSNPGKNTAPSEWDKELSAAVDYVKKQGISDGSRVNEPLTRGQFFVMLKRMKEKGL